MPMCQASSCATVAKSWPLDPLQVLQNSGSWMFMLRVKTLAVQDATAKSEGKKLLRAQQYKTLECQCTYWLSATHNFQGAAESLSTAGLNPKLPYYLLLTLTTQPLVHVSN